MRTSDLFWRRILQHLPVSITMRRDIRTSLIVRCLRLLSFQEKAVKTFLKDHPPPFTNGQFNNSGNVSFVSWDFLAIFSNSFFERHEDSPTLLPTGT
jgi:hypothetical protein